ncbi:epidermal growth factor receptor-like [Haliotis rubra]|uniref:epidermal growth factor receptor-like n=1 Tax=Haliotis rubra TaxID=36100 RepID=UPI001EE54612|nr:epidermal growth factor receptor-like [Haliotis rubra]
MMLLTLVVLVLVATTADGVAVVSNDIPDTGITENDTVCSGGRSSMQLSTSGSPSWWYRDMIQTYTNCTYVDGNLIITWLTDDNINYDLNFLRNIRYVRGYVLIARADGHFELNLPRLEVIRGNSTFTFHGDHYGLAVLLTNFTAVRIPRLKEITNGKVIFFLNLPDIRVEITRDWDQIVRGRESRHPGTVTFQHEPPVARHYDVCPSRCPQRCFWYGAGCCHHQCAGGCWGPSPTQCETCKDFELDGVCLSHCPNAYYRHGRRCLRNPWYRGRYHRH